MADGDHIASRICTRCKTSKPATAEFYHARKKNADGCREVCKKCRAADNLAHNAERTAKKREHYRQNKDRLLESVRAYYRENVEAQRKAGLDRHYKNRDKRIEQMRAYRAANLDALNERRRPKSREAFHARYGSDLVFTLKHRMRALLHATLANGRQGKRMAELLGYGMDELRSHLERQFTKGMSWEAFLAGEIHVDHIIPASTFNAVDYDSDEFRACWALPNLRPMWARENLSKGDKVLTLL